MKLLTLGGSGFIGTNLAASAQSRGDEVIVFDNLSRRGSGLNMQWLVEQGVRFVHGDIRDQRALEELFATERGVDAVFHLAAQTAVTTSVSNPREDFEVNALGTFNVLEVMRAHSRETPLIYASTNKVYGAMDDLVTVERDGRYEYRDLPYGIDETRLLDFHSPYGCSKGAADQYVLDYARIYGMRTVVFRQSCIYGPRQFGMEDQGWLAWFVIASVTGQQITIFGDGKQVRDVLFVDDLVDAYFRAVDVIDCVSGQAFNIGGGAFRLSLLELVGHLEKRIGRAIPLTYADWRQGDQRVFVNNLSKIGRELGWQPTTDVEAGLDNLIEWVKGNRSSLTRANRA